MVIPLPATRKSLYYPGWGPIRKTEYLEKKTVLILYVRFSEPDDLAGEVNMPVWTQQGTARWEPVSGAAYYELRLI